MSLDLSAVSLIRGGSGVVEIAVGITLALAWRGARGRRVAGAGLGVFVAAPGISFVFTNLAGTDAVLLAAAVTAQSVLFGIAAIGGLVYVLGAYPRRQVAWAVAMNAVIGALAAWAIITSLDPVRAFGPIKLSYQSFAIGQVVDEAFVACGAAIAMLAALRAASAGEGERRSYALLAVGVCAIIAYSAGGFLARATTTPAFLSDAIVFTIWAVSIGAMWLARTPREGKFVAVGILTLALVAEFEGALLPAPVGFTGIIRTTAALLVLLGALRLSHRGKGMLPGRASGAVVALAALFIVAQVAQNFLAAQFGLVMGGVVAGVFLFAAQPLQRALERNRDPEPRTPTASAEREALYLDAVRLAMRDMTLTLAEERHLVRLAHSLSIDGARALSLREQVEREATNPEKSPQA